MVNQTETKVIYQGDGKTTVFPIGFSYDNKDDVNVILSDGETETVLTKDYYVDTEANTVTYPGYAPGEAPAASEQPAVLASGWKLVVYRETPLTQLTDLGEKYPLPIIETGWDKLTYIVQELAETLSRCLKNNISGGETIEKMVQLIKDSTASAGTSASKAASSASAASASAGEASTSASNAKTSEANAKTSETNAAKSQAGANVSEKAAATSAQIAQTNATLARDAKAAVQQMAGDVSTWRTQAAASSANAAKSESGAAGSAQTAKNYADDAEVSADHALASAQQAASAQSAASVAQAETQRIAAAASAMDVPAWDATTVYSYPAVVAYTDGQSYRCVGTDVPAGETPNTSKWWVPLTVRGGDDFWDIDIAGGIEPQEQPRISAAWCLDDDGNIMPRLTESDMTVLATTTAETYAAQAATAEQAASASATAASESETAAKAAQTAAETAQAAAEAAQAEVDATNCMEKDSDGNVTVKE